MRKNPSVAGAARGAFMTTEFDMPDLERPIGYWLKLCSDLLERYVSDEQAVNGIDRLDWQVLNVVRSGVTDIDAIAAELPQFADRRLVVERLEALRGRGLIDASQRISEHGVACYDRFAQTQDRIRRVVSEHISETDYRTTISVLKTIAANVERAAS